MNNNKPIELFLNGAYVCTTTQSKTCREAIQKVWSKARTSGMLLPVAGRENVSVAEDDLITANFKRKKGNGMTANKRAFLWFWFLPMRQGKGKRKCT